MLIVDIASAQFVLRTSKNTLEKSKFFFFKGKVVSVFYQIVLVLSTCWVFVRNESFVRFLKYAILNELVILNVEKILNL